ncbi:hypothetical protein BC830DRAFT_1132345 [Chytriomyces sp. MP71]|nr:hypothetical protein BC830DRAFT_1132345 [Chytriomyces sp. MP71]
MIIWLTVLVVVVTVMLVAVLQEMLLVNGCSVGHIPTGCGKLLIQCITMESLWLLLERACGTTLINGDASTIGCLCGTCLGIFDTH